MRLFAALPGWASAILWLLILIVAVILVAMIVHALGGFKWDLQIGHFRLLVGVS